MPAQPGQKLPSVGTLGQFLSPVDASAVTASLQCIAGQVTLNGVTPVNIAAAAVKKTSMIFFSLNDVNAGTQGAVPTAVPTAGTGFAVKGTAADVGIYNYIIIV